MFTSARHRIRRTWPVLVGAGALVLLGPAAALGVQDSNIRHPVETVEKLLTEGEFKVVARHGSRFKGDRTQRTVLAFEDGPTLQVKWAKAARGGGAFNNRPRYELAIYRLQKLFLDPEEYVVPPTVVRCFDKEWYEQMESLVRPTFDDTKSVMAVLQYWLWNVTAKDVFDEERFRSDTVYARHLANVDLLTYLVEHQDSNKGNVLVSADPTNPRVFAVDNGLMLDAEEHNRGETWKKLRVEKVPAGTVERLRELTRQDLEDALAVLVQFEEKDGRLVRVPPTENFDPGDGVRRKDGVLQLGLKDWEIDDIWSRTQELLEDVDDGELETF